MSRLRHALACASLLLVVAGCGAVTKPTGVITIPRQEFVNTWALAKAIYLRHAAAVRDLCKQGRLSREQCAAAAAGWDQARRLDLEVEAKLLVPESEINWGAVLKMLELTAGLVL